ncbi:MAG: DNA repair protein RadA [Clostridiales bacterium]|nr:DNA repair protein RadA [Clostridiales bacterium]
MKGLKTIYICSECGHQASQWSGQCPSCRSWNSMVEDVISQTPKTSAKHPSTKYNNEPVRFDDYEIPEYFRTKTGLGELDRVLGGGIVNGSVVLLSGEPGIGKSTLLLQISGALGEGRKVLYVSGEESKGQIKMRAGRLGVTGTSLYLLVETNVDAILAAYDKLRPDVIIIDSIQTIYADSVSSAPGSITQVKDAAMRFISLAKNEGVSVLLVGHVNKEGSIAGPKVLEHMVDAVLYFEGERQHIYRIIRAIKNRFGSTNEIGVFEMTETGLKEVPNPSETMLASRPKNVSGNCAACVMQGTRPIIAEIQALTTQTMYPSPKRASDGIDYNRMGLLIAVLEKRMGLRLSALDIYLNVIGGLHLSETAADAAVAIAIYSSMKDKPVPDDLIAFGEIGLSGEVRAVSGIDQRVKEAIRLGFTQIVLPYKSADRLEINTQGASIIPIRSIIEITKLL